MIAVIDSGVGGLSVLQALEQELPDIPYVYHADSMYAPYGDKSPEFLIDRVNKIAQFLISHYPISSFILACNTSSSYVLPSLTSLLLPHTIVLHDIISAAITATIEAIPAGSHVGVLATPATVQSGSYTQKLQSAGFYPHLIACPTLVPFIEQGILEGADVEHAVNMYLEELFLTSPDISTIILGCTHYPFLLPVFENVARRLQPKTHVRFMNPAHQCARTVRERMHTTSDDDVKKSSVFLTTGDVQTFQRVASNILKRDIHAKHSVIEE